MWKLIYWLNLNISYLGFIHEVVNILVWIYLLHKRPNPSGIDFLIYDYILQNLLMIQLDLFFSAYSYIIFNFYTLHIRFRHLFLNTLNNQASVLYQLVGRRRFCFEKLEKHYWSSGIEFLYLKTPLGTELLNTSDTYNTMLEKKILQMCRYYFSAEQFLGLVP